MSDLTGKFGSFETQIAANHTAIMDALGGINSALGGAPTDTFADLVAAITQSNVLLAAIRADSNTKLNAIYNLLDTMNNNASLNAQRILLLMLQTACACDPDLPLLPPILDVTPTSATDQEKCRRIQYFIDLFRLGWGSNIASYISDYGMINSSQVDNLRGLAISELGITTGQIANSMPTGTRDSIVAKIAYIVGFVGAPAVGSALLAAFTDTDLIEAIRQALYAATDATSGADAFAAAVNGASLASDYQSIIVSMFYSAWPNDIYSAVPDVDDSAYDGDACGDSEIPCFQIISTDWGSNGNGHWYGVDWTGYASTDNWVVAGGLVFKELTDMALDGYIITVLSSSGDLYRSYARASSGTTWSPSHQIDLAQGYLSMYSNSPFTIEICPP